ncbi:MAG: serine--tRNA ligase [Candidatus Helarchaeota archaeon]
MPKWSVLQKLKENKVDEYKKTVSRRGKDPKIVDEFWSAYNEYLDLFRLYGKRKHELNVVSMQLSKNYSDELRESAKKLKAEVNEIEKNMKNAKNKYIELSYKLPNLILPGVPDGIDEDDNVPIEYWGKPKVWSEYIDQFLEMTKGFDIDYEEISWKPAGHVDLLEDILKMGNTQQAARVVGSRFYYLFDDISWLDFALSLFTIDFLTKKGFKFVIPPYMVRWDVIKAALDHETFLDMIYKIENEDLYLIGTAEHPLLALYIDRLIEEDELPLKFIGWSPCFRKEAGSAGKDTKGIFRVHQFHKIEQFVFCNPDIELSEKLFQEMVDNTKQIWELLEIPYRVLSMCTGELADQAARKYDIEVWYPAQCKYRELASISNCLDWQAYRGPIHFRLKETGKLEYPFTLNGTGLPTSRAICAILENYQQEDGTVIVPKVLKKYLEPFEMAPKDIISPSN